MICTNSAIQWEGTALREIATEEINVSYGEEFSFQNVAPFSCINLSTSDRDTIKTDPISISVKDAKIISKDAFEDLCGPLDEFDSVEANSASAKVFLVTTSISNLSDSAFACVPNLTLWSDNFVQSEELTESGAPPSMGAAIALRSFPGGKYSDVAQRTEGCTWDVLQPSESKEVVFVYLVHRQSFANATVFDRIELDQYCVRIEEYISKIGYCFWLA